MGLNFILENVKGPVNKNIMKGGYKISP